MKISAYIKHYGAGLVAILASMFTTTSCDNAIYDDEGDCSITYRLHFLYDMNMKFADAFSHEVKSVTVYAFDENGKFVASQTDEGKALSKPGYAMNLNLPAGKYHLIAWCGLDNGESFTVPGLNPGSSTAERLTCSLNRKYDATKGGAYVDDDLHALFHGELDVTLPGGDAYGVYNDTMPLVKNTNNVRIVLQHLSGKDVNVDDFKFRIIDENALMAHDNKLLGNDTITYHAWYTDSGVADVEQLDTKPVKGEFMHVKTALAELTTARLVKRDEVRPVLKVTNPEGKDIISIPIIDYFLLVKGHYNRTMDDQEYLDRQDEYSLTFFLDDRGEWISSSIIINSWRVVLQDAEL